MKQLLLQKLTSLKNIVKNFINKRPKLTLVLAGLGSIFAYAPFSLWAIMFICFIILNYCLTLAKTKRQKLGYFTIFTYLFNVVNLHWVGNSFLYNSPEPYLVYFMPLLVAGMSLLLTIPYVLLFMLFNKAKHTTVKQIVLIPLVFLTAEFFRSLTVFGFPWNLVGYSIASNDYLLQATELGTILVCTFLILIIASLIATFRKKAITAAFAIFIVWFTAGAIRFETKDFSKVAKVAEETKTIQIDLVKHHNFDRIKMRKIFFTYLKQVKKAAKDKAIKTIILPEMAVPYPINTEDQLLSLLKRSIRKDQVLITGAPSYNDYDVYNSMYYITREGFLKYDKIMLVPFGEFIPFRGALPFLRNFTNNFKDFSVGFIGNTIPVQNKKYLSLICYEAIFPFFVKENIIEEDTILLNITNDAWFYGTVAPSQHALIAKTRAVENNLPMVRLANAGISFIK